MTEAASILLVEDDAALRRGLIDALRSEGYAVSSASDGAAGMDAVAQRRFDLVVLDLMLPGPGGLEILRRLRRDDADTPVVILTAKGDEDDRVLGLELGADDYVTKPFSLRELLARVRARLRRSQRASPTGAPRFKLGAVEVDLGTFEVRRDGAVETLSPKEAAILRLLHGALGDAVSRERFLDEVWGRDQFVGNRTVDTHVLNVRSKIEADPKHPRHLLTVHGIGYRLVT